MMNLPQVGWTVAASLVEVEESPHSKERGAGETPGRSNLPDRATENKLPSPFSLPLWERAGVRETLHDSRGFMVRGDTGVMQG